MHLLLGVTHESEEQAPHNGLPELLEILASITNGLSAPLKQEHVDFFRKVLVPLHKVKELTAFNGPLLVCVKNFLEKQPALAVDLIQGLLKFWPITCPPKEVVFINVIEDVVDLTVGQQPFVDYGPELLKRLVLSANGMHY